MNSPTTTQTAADEEAIRAIHQRMIDAGKLTVVPVVPAKAGIQGECGHIGPPLHEGRHDELSLRFKARDFQPSPREI